MTDDVNDVDNNEVSLCEMPILDPQRRKGKGISYGRLKSSSEKKKKKSKKGTPLMLTESRELVVQVTHDETHVLDYLRNSNQTQNAFCPSNIGGPIIQAPYIMPAGIMNNFSSFTSQMQPSYIMPHRNMNGFPSFNSQMQTPYIMPSRIMNGFSPFTSQENGRILANPIRINDVNFLCKSIMLGLTMPK
ncbi:hypothetical protein BT93_H2715 [Corymbia citriodora subsp. variegata]|nr:hypothetical protein BT93_H2715 [Corymbia citriodora subsp. variegata]